MSERRLWRYGPWPMPWPLDSLPPASALDRRRAASWAEGWLEATKWWTDALSERQRRWPEVHWQLLDELVEGVVRRYRGRRVVLVLRGREVSGILEQLWFDRTARRPVRLELRDVELGRAQFESVAIEVEALGLTSPPDLALTATGIRIEARSRLQPLVAWLDERVRDWRLGVDDELRIAAARAGSPIELALDASVVDDRLHLDARALRWRRVRVRAPSWLRLTRSRPLPRLPAGLTVSEARRRGARVELRLLLPSFRHGVDLAALRDALSREGSPSRDA